MNRQDAITHFRSPDPAGYPELAGYSREEIYDGTIGGGALYLAAKMTRLMRLEPADIVLDLGCGRGATSVFLARHFGVQAIGVDLWTPVDETNAKIEASGYRGRIIPLNLDVTGRLPFADGYFDAIFCMNSFSFYGGSVDFLRHLLRHLKPGGELCVGGEILSAEFAEEERAHPPAVFDYNLPPPNEHINVWEADFSKMRSPGWWADLCRASGLLDVTHCAELDDAIVLYEDLVKFQIQHDLDPEDVDISIRQIEWGHDHTPYKTLFALRAHRL